MGASVYQETQTSQIQGFVTKNLMFLTSKALAVFLWKKKKSEDIEHGRKFCTFPEVHIKLNWDKMSLDMKEKIIGP